jgi:hypothetical protein
MLDLSNQMSTVNEAASRAGCRLTLSADAMVLTLRGESRAGDLAAGDRIITRDTGTATLRALSTGESTMSAIRVRAGSLGHTRPECDMILPPDTLVHIRDWRAPALCKTPTADLPATSLIDGEFIAAEPAAPHELVTLIFDRDHIIYADGLEIRAAHG